MKWFQKILLALFGLSFHRATPKVCSPIIYDVDWTEGDAEQLKAFLSNPTGTKLLLKGRAMEATTAIAACRGNLNPNRAAGISDTLDWLNSLQFAGASPVKEATEDSPTENADTLTRLSYT